MKAFTKAVAVGAMLVSVLASAQPADAHSVWSRIYGPGQWPPVRGEVKGDHGYLWVCDTNADNIGVWVEYELSNYATGVFTDGNGSQSGCGGTDNWWNAELRWFNAHSRDGGSTGWIYVAPH